MKIRNFSPLTKVVESNEIRKHYSCTYYCVWTCTDCMNIHLYIHNKL